MYKERYKFFRIKPYSFKGILLVLLATGFPTKISAQDIPNIIFYLTDDQGQADASVYGAPGYLQTPGIDCLAADGMVFENAYVASPACAPSRAALLTSLMPARNGAEANHTYPKDNRLFLTHTFCKAGFQVAAFGKVAHGPSKPEYGFDYFDNVPKRGDLSGAVSKYYSNHASTNKPQLIMVGDKRPHVIWSEEMMYDPEKVIVPSYFINTRETREHWSRYLTDITGLDHELMEVYEWVKSTFGRNFIFIYTSDHGGQWPFGKWNLYEAGIKVPFIMVWPGMIEPGSRTEAMISWIDVIPTLCENAGINLPDSLDGLSFMHVLENPAAQHRQAIFATHSGDGHMNTYPIRSVRMGSFKYIRNLNPGFYHNNHSDFFRKDGAGAYWDSWDSLAMEDPRASYIRYKYYIRPAEEFYYLESDPFEQENLISCPNHQSVLNEMRSMLDCWMYEQGDTKALFSEPHPITGPRPGRSDTIKSKWEWWSENGLIEKY